MSSIVPGTEYSDILIVECKMPLKGILTVTLDTEGDNGPFHQLMCGVL